MIATAGVTVEEQPEVESNWTWDYPWRFRNVVSLREDGLEQYTAFADSVKIGRYGEYIGNEVDAESHMCALRKRKEIDLCLLELKYPAMRNLLVAYYRQGRSCDHRGWMDTARRTRVQGVHPRQCPGGHIRCQVGDDRMDLPKCEIGHKGCQTDHDTFQVQVALAIGRLWHVHVERWKRINDAGS